MWLASAMLVSRMPLTNAFMRAFTSILMSACLSYSTHKIENDWLESWSVEILFFFSMSRVRTSPCITLSQGVNITFHWHVISAFRDCRQYWRMTFLCSFQSDFKKYWKTEWNWRYGNCFTFNSGSLKDGKKIPVLTSNKPGPKYGK